MITSALAGKTSPFEEPSSPSSSISMVTGGVRERAGVEVAEGPGGGVGTEDVAFVLGAVTSVSEFSVAVWALFRGFFTALIKVSIGAWSFRLVALIMRPRRLVVVELESLVDMAQAKVGDYAL